MKALLGIILSSLLLVSAPGWAIDCAKAATAIDKRICSDRKLKAADDAMSAAYFKLLGSIKDPEIHASLIESQRRWIKTRAQDIHIESETSSAADASDRAQERNILLYVIRDRTKYLANRSREPRDFLATALMQRKRAQAYSGGPYAGYIASCYFISDRTDPERWDYECFGQITYQNDNRICSETNDFASYTYYTTQYLTVIEGGELKPVAKFAYPDEKWEKSTESSLELPSDGNVMTKIDPELTLNDEYDDTSWMHACLTDPSFPFDAKYMNE